jgi:hypothetical protein
MCCVALDQATNAPDWINPEGRLALRITGEIAVKSGQGAAARRLGHDARTDAIQTHTHRARGREREADTEERDGERFRKREERTLTSRL